ncbi:DUF2382 domain-containing protein [Kitasatospora sp. NPDC004669]|uniref:PRC and DUF2382 domain-containing protein n=1 Tax=Kitasatospora sp. NPDC004669 TaxID=3154555 RepID=UPI0033AC30F5
MLRPPYLREFRRRSALEARVQTDIDPRDLIGHKAVDRNGDKIGTVDEVYLDDATGQPEWAAVRTGVFGRDAFVPLATSEFSDNELRVPYDKSLVKDSPDFGVGQHLSPAQELQLYRYYGLDTRMDGRPTTEEGGRTAEPDLDFGTTPAAGEGGRTAEPDLDFGTTPAAGEGGRTAQPNLDFGTTPAAEATKPLAFRSPEPAATPTTSTTTSTTAATKPPAFRPPEPAAAPTVEPKPRPAETRATRAPATGGAASPSAPSGPVEITCREERLDITTQWHILGTAKLRKYVTTEQVERRVPVVRERVRVERMPVSEAERSALTEKAIAESVEQVTLREERLVVRKYRAPIERVRLVVERYTTEEVVREELRREHVEVHDNTPATPTPPANAPSQPPTPDSHAASLRTLP